MIRNNKDIVQMNLNKSETSFVYSEWTNYNFRGFNNGLSDFHHPIISAEVLDSSRTFRRLMMLYKIF